MPRVAAIVVRSVAKRVIKPPCDIAVVSAVDQALDRRSSVPTQACEAPHAGVLPPRNGLCDAPEKRLAAINNTLLLCAPS